MVRDKEIKELIKTILYLLIIFGTIGGFLILFKLMMWVSR